MPAASPFQMTTTSPTHYDMRVGVDPPRLEEHPDAERQFPHHAGTAQQRQHRAQFLVGKPLEIAGQPQLQGLAQFIEPHQHPALVLEADDLLLEPPEEHLRGAAGNLVPIDAGEDGLHDGFAD